MRYRRNSELNVFGIGALDVFASAMGVFMLIAVILFPYYMKNEDAVASRAEALREARAAKAEAEKALNEADAARAEAERASREAARYRDRAETAVSDLQQTFILVLISWSTMDDVDLHVRDPAGEWFSWERPRVMGRPGELSKDVIRGPGNEVWQVEAAEVGDYHICANLFSPRETRPLKVVGNVYHKNGRIPLPEVRLSRQGASRVRPLGVIRVDEEGTANLNPHLEATCPDFQVVEYDPKRS